MKLRKNEPSTKMRVISYMIAPTTTQSIILGCLTYAASKLWNVGNYGRRNWTKDSGEPYPDWYHQKKTLKTHFWYKNLPSQSAQEVLKQLEEAWKSFYRLKETGGIENPKPPRFKQKPFNIRYLNNGFKVQDTAIRLPIPKQLKEYIKEKHHIENRYLYIPIPKEYRNTIQNPKIVEIIPANNGKYKIHITVEQSIPETIQQQQEEIYMSIDLGINNLAACYISTGKTFIISGRQLVSIERYFDKTIAHYQSISDAQQAAKGIKYPKKSKRVLQLYEKRKKQINHFLHAATKTIADIAKQERVTKVIIGDITNIREDKNYGPVNNQKLHKWAFNKIKALLVYKLEDIRIATDLQEESYSSQCSPYSKEVSKEYTEKKNRKYRGLYKVNNRILNADCVGAFNILRKYLCRMKSFIHPAVVGLDSPVMYRWNGYRFIENSKLAISMAM